jgi:adenylate cyclase
MAEHPAQRRLAAILAADVVGYSRLMGQDEAGTLAVLKARRRDVLEPLVAKFKGRVFKVTGDGVLVEFASAVNGVQCAVELQRAFAAANGDLPAERQIALRIGVNLGDVMVEGSDLYGDSVNIAARLEALAEPGGILLSGTAYDHVKNKIATDFDDLGAQALKNIAEPVHAYRVIGTPRVSAAAAGSHDDKPSIALMPFINMSGDPTQDYISDGITENIIAGLSRFRDLLVIASNSTFAYKGKAVRIQDVSRALGVRFVLEGSVQKSSDRIRITAQLIDGMTGQHLWSERYDRGVEDIFAVQDDVTEMIVSRLATAYGGRLRKAWQGRTANIGLQSLRAYDYHQRGMDTYNRFSKDNVVEARIWFQKAIELDPGYGKPYAKIAWTHMTDVNMGWSGNVADSLAKAQEFANLAIAHDDDEGWGHWALAGYHLYRGQHDRAISEYKRAIELNPNDADVLNDFGQCLSYAGRAAEGVQVVRKAMRLNPHHPEYWEMQFGPILFDARQYEEAIATLESLHSLDTIFAWLYLAASHAALGHEEQARDTVARIHGLDPSATLAQCTAPSMAPYKNPADLQHFRENLRKAGLPE